MNNPIFQSSLAVAVTILLGGCGVSGSTPAPVVTTVTNQQVLCEIENWQQGIAKCAEGDVVSFLPPSWGNDQVPLMAASALCNFNYPVVHNKGGVVCVHTKKRMENLLANQAKTNPPPAGGNGEKKN